MAEETRAAPKDLGILLGRVHALSEKGGSVHLQAAGREELEAYRRRLARGDQKPRLQVVLAQDTAVELGPPGRASLNLVLWTQMPGKIADRRVTLLGPDLPALPLGENDYAQVIMVGVPAEKEVNPFRLEAAQFLSERLPGVMARMIPGRLWIRVNKKARAAGVNFSLLAAALCQAYQELLGEEAAVECVFVTAGRTAVESFSGLAGEARILSGEHKKISLGLSGEYECVDLNCERCEEKPECDQIREAVVIRRKEKRKT